VPDLRPLSVGEIIDVAIKIWRRHFATLARIVFVVVAPVQVLSTLVATSAGDFETFDPTTGEPTVDGGALAGWVAGMGVAQLLAGLAFLISSAAVLRAVSVAYLGGTPDWRDSLRAATGRIGSLIWLGFLMFGGLMLSAFALLFPAIWLGVSWSIAYPVLIAEGQRGRKALGRSFHLVEHRWWPTFGALFLAFLLQSFIGLVLGLPLGFLTANAESDALWAILLTMAVGIVSSVVTTPFMAAVLVLIYFDLRVRKEGFDLQLLSQGVGIPGDALPAEAPWLGGGSSGGHWGGVPGNWGEPGGNWPSPSGGPAGWAPPGTGRPASDPQSTGPPPAPRFDDPIDPTGPARDTPPAWWTEPAGPPGGGPPQGPGDAAGSTEEAPPPPGEQPER